MNRYSSKASIGLLLLVGLGAACSSNETAGPGLGSAGSGLGGSAAASGGASSGGAGSGAPAGGSTSGGLSGSKASGGTASGGSASAGASNGGKASGGSAIGGKSSGGSANGGATSTGSGGAGGGTSGGGATGSKASPGCSATATVATGTALDKTITVGTRDRTYRLSVPADYVPGTPLPLMFGLNGVGGNGKGAQSSFKLETNHRGIFVYPDAIYKESSGTADWDYTSNGYDVAFFDALIAELTQTYCVDMNHIFSVGVSAGGIMSNMLGCFRGDVLRAIAPASAMMWQNTCRGDVAVMIFCGAQDTFNPCDTDGKTETDFWRARSSCGTQTAESPVASICNAFQGCAATNDPVLLCTHSGGHMWPTGGGDIVWSFFMGL